MKIYAFDDKEVKAANAERAILDAGHTCGAYYKDGHSFSKSHEKLLRFHAATAHSMVRGRARLMFDMVEHSIADAKANGGGIITDLMFHLSPPRDSETSN